MIRPAAVLAAFAALALSPAAAALAAGHAGAALSLLAVALITEGWGQADRAGRWAWPEGR
jgi:hypothetical protein